MFGLFKKRATPASLRLSIIRRSDFSQTSLAIMSCVGEILCEAKGRPAVFSNILYGAWFGDPSMSLAAAYGALKNGLTVEEASLTWLHFDALLRLKRMAAGRDFETLLNDPEHKDKLDELNRLAEVVGPRFSLISNRVDWNQFLADIAEYFTLK